MENKKEMEAQMQQVELMVDEEILTRRMIGCIETIILTYSPRFSVSSAGRTKILKWIHEFGFNLVSHAVRISFDRYFDGETAESWNLAFLKIGGVCRNISMGPYGNKLE